MNCYKPLRIKNQYNGKFLHVNCRNCDACLVSQANHKAALLSESLKQYKYNYLLTLTYKNDFVPYMIDGLDGFIFRGQNDVENIDWVDVKMDWSLKYKHLRNHFNKSAIGVIYYYDFQCFLKRFRKYVNKHYGRKEFKYFAICEYGTKFARPHAHIAIMSNELLYEECQVASFESWTYHDWNRFFKNGENQGCKRVDEGCASYISSYVNSISNRLPISLYKEFCQKTFRSKNIYFGINDKILAEYKKDVIGLHKGLDAPRNRSYFEYLQQDRLGDVAYKPVQSQYIYTFFQKFKGFNELSFNAQLSRAGYIVERIKKARKLDIPLCNIGLSSMDLNFYRSYVRFNEEFKILHYGQCNLYHYLTLMHRVFNVYKSNLLKRQMLDYCRLGSDQYFMTLIDTGIEKDNMKFKLFGKVKDSNLRKRIGELPPLVVLDLDEYVYKYKKKLLGKHLNDRNLVLEFD